MAFYVYDALGQRIRKMVEKNKGNLIEERIYLGGFEVYRKHQGSPATAISADTATLERETLHLMDDKQRIALVETRTFDKAGGDQAPRQLIRYQLGNHLGSSSVELDENAQIISYEEYAPYGSSTYQAVRSQTETAKRYRYTGKERDEETSLCYHKSRYYAPWLGRWINTDPDQNELRRGWVYSYAHNNPLALSDPNGLAPTSSNKPSQFAIEPASRSAQLGLDYSGLKVSPLTSDFVLTGQLVESRSITESTISEVAPTNDAIDVPDFEPDPAGPEKVNALCAYYDYLKWKYGTSDDQAAFWESTVNPQPSSEADNGPEDFYPAAVPSGARAPNIRVGEIKPDNPERIREGIAQLKMRETRQPTLEEGNVALVLYNVATGNITQTVWGPGQFRTYGPATEGDRVVIWEGLIGRINIPNYLSPQEVGKLLEPAVRHTAEIANQQLYLGKSSSKTGADLEPIPVPHIRVNLIRRPEFEVEPFRDFE
jgi:RHS repeat-associated protein